MQSHFSSKLSRWFQNALECDMSQVMMLGVIATSCWKLPLLHMMASKIELTTCVCY